MTPHPDSVTLRGAAHRTMAPVLVVGGLVGAVLGWLLVQGLLLIA